MSFKRKKGEDERTVQAVFLMQTVKQHETQILFVSLKYYVNWYPVQFSYSQFQYLPEKLGGRNALGFA